MIAPVAARKVRQKQWPIVLAMVADLSGCSLWRILQPTKYLEAQGWKTWWTEHNHWAMGHFATMADVIILPRISWPAEWKPVAEEFFAMVRRTGKKVIYEADDDLFTADYAKRTIDSGWATQEQFRKVEADRFSRLWTMGQCDAVTVTTPELAEVVRPFTDGKVYVVPNALDLPWFEDVLRRSPRVIDGLTIGWAGGKRSEADVVEMGEAWRRIAARYPQVKFVTAGWVSETLQTCVPRDRLYHIGWQGLDHYPSTYRQIDIGCAAVEPREFNATKTVIKAWEYTAAGAAVVATPFLYDRWVRHDVNGLLATTADEWEHQLSRLIEDRWLRQRLQRKAYRKLITENTLAVNAHRWIDCWTEVARSPSRQVA